MNKELNTQKKKILILDASSFYLKIITKRFADTFELFTTTSPEKALKLALTEKVDLIITDYDMPQMSGLKFSKLVKDDGLMSHIPIIIFSSHESDELKINSYEAGVDAYLNKSVDEKLFLARVKSILKAKELQFKLYKNLKQSYSDDLNTAKEEQAKTLREALERLRLVLVKFSNLKSIYNKKTFDPEQEEKMAKDKIKKEEILGRISL